MTRRDLFRRAAMTLGSAVIAPLAIAGDASRFASGGIAPSEPPAPAPIAPGETNISEPGDRHIHINCRCSIDSAEFSRVLRLHSDEIARIVRDGQARQAIRI